MRVARKWWVEQESGEKVVRESGEKVVGGACERREGVGWS